MAENKKYFRHIMQGKVSAVYDNETIEDFTSHKWFRVYRENNFSLNVAPPSGRQSETDFDKILTLNGNYLQRIINKISLTSAKLSLHTKKIYFTFG